MRCQLFELELDRSFFIHSLEAASCARILQIDVHIRMQSADETARRFAAVTRSAISVSGSTRMFYNMKMTRCLREFYATVKAA
jgi:hypothetical protein